MTDIQRLMFAYTDGDFDLGDWNVGEDADLLFMKDGIPLTMSDAEIKKFRSVRDAWAKEQNKIWNKINHPDWHRHIYALLDDSQRQMVLQLIADSDTTHGSFIEAFRAVLSPADDED